MEGEAANNDKSFASRFEPSSNFVELKIIESLKNQLKNLNIFGFLFCCLSSLHFISMALEPEKLRIDLDHTKDRQSSSFLTMRGFGLLIVPSTKLQSILGAR